MEIDASVAGSLTASLDTLTGRIGGLCDRLDRQARHELEVRQSANQWFRQVQFAGAITLTAGAGTLQDFQRFGCPQGYYWSVRRLTAQGFTAGTVTAYRDSTTGEPLMPFPVAAVNTIGKGEMVLAPMSQLVFGATGITGTVTVWGAADQFEQWLLPWYMGADRGEA